MAVLPLPKKLRCHSTVPVPDKYHAMPSAMQEVAGMQPLRVPQTCNRGALTHS